jgi:hypothetical protein
MKLYLLSKHHVELQFHILLTLAADWGELVSHTSQFTTLPRGKISLYHSNRRLRENERIGLRTVEKRKQLVSSGNRTLVPRSSNPYPKPVIFHVGYGKHLTSFSKTKHRNRLNLELVLILAPTNWQARTTIIFDKIFNSYNFALLKYLCSLLFFLYDVIIAPSVV